MLFSNMTERNDTAELQRQGLFALVLYSVTTTLSCCVFLFINLNMLVTLRSREVFKETPRYVLLSNLLFADTVQLAHAQSMLLLSACRVTMLYWVCAALTAFSQLTTSASLVTLVLMCLERYVAVCCPLRYAAIVSTRNTGAVIFAVWCFSAVSMVSQLSLILRLSFDGLQLEKMSDYCGKKSVFLDPVSDFYHKASTYFLFVLGGVTVTFSYAGIIVAAQSASTSRASASRARNTLLLHLVQLGLSMSSTIHNSLLIAVSQNLDRVVAINLQVLLYVCMIMFPKCLSSLIYGLRDRTIRPALMWHLGCQWRSSTLIFAPEEKNKTTAA